MRLRSKIRVGAQASNFSPTDANPALPGGRGIGMSNVSLPYDGGLAKDVAITLLASATALIHLKVGLVRQSTSLLVNGLGYSGILAGLNVTSKGSENYHIMRYALMAYTALTIGAYFWVFGGGAFAYMLGLTTKLIEVALIALLWMEADD
jgi:hypothetical protein